MHIIIYQVYPSLGTMPLNFRHNIVKKKKPKGKEVILATPGTKGLYMKVFLNMPFYDYPLNILDEKKIFNFNV